MDEANVAYEAWVPALYPFMDIHVDDFHLLLSFQLFALSFGKDSPSLIRSVGRFGHSKVAPVLQKPNVIFC